MKQEEKIKQLEEEVKDLQERFNVLQEAEARSVLTPEQTAEYLQIDAEEVVGLCRAKKIPCANLLGNYRIPKWLLDEKIAYYATVYGPRDIREDD